MKLTFTMVQLELTEASTQNSAKRPTPAPVLWLVTLTLTFSHSLTACKLHHACLSFVSVHRMAPPLPEAANIQLQLTTRLLTPKGWKVELAWLVDVLRTVYPHKWSPISYRSSAGQRKFAGQKPTFYRCATQTTQTVKLI